MPLYIRYEITYIQINQEQSPTIVLVVCLLLRYPALVVV